jgi:hypothetical protein
VVINRFRPDVLQQARLDVINEPLRAGSAGRHRGSRRAVDDNAARRESAFRDAFLE